jgi:hypothetical protein
LLAMRRTKRQTPAFVLLVGGDETTAQLCARAAAPVPVVRANHLGTAADRLRSLRPVALIVASDVETDALKELQRVARDTAAKVVRLEATNDVPSVERLRRMMA